MPEMKLQGSVSNADDVDNDNNSCLFASFKRTRFIAETMAIKIWIVVDGVALKRADKGTAR